MPHWLCICLLREYGYIDRNNMVILLIDPTYASVRNVERLSIVLIYYRISSFGNCKKNRHRQADSGAGGEFDLERFVLHEIYSGFCGIT